MLKFNKLPQMIMAIACLFVFSGLVAVQVSAPALASAKQQVEQGTSDVGGGDAGNEGTQVAVVIKNVIGILSFLVGLVAVLMIVIAGFRFVTSNGDAATAKSARETIIYAVIGIIITVMAYAIVNFIIDNV